MKYRKFGKYNIKLSEIGFGAWGIGKITKYSPGYYGVTDKNSIAGLNKSFDSGINYFDTSNMYGNGHSEKLIGEVFKNKRDKIIISSKGGCLPHKSLIMPQNFEKNFLTKSLEKSLKRLKTDYLDIFFLHSPKFSDIKKFDILNTLEKFRKNGKIRIFGISCRTPDDALKFYKTFKIDVFQINFNLLDLRAKYNGLFDLSKKKNIALVARTPLVFGFLTKKIKKNINFKKLKDHRANFSEKLRNKWIDSTNLFDNFYKKYKFTPAQFALRYCLDIKELSSVIPGMVNTNEVLENCTTSNLRKIEKIDQHKIDDIYKNSFSKKIIEISKNKKND
jgi:aryl-alcohol dehydrogenase-like predicted oxidoreductase